MTIVIDLFVLCLTCGFAVLGVRIGLRRMILLGMLAIPAAVVGMAVCLAVSIHDWSLTRYTPASLLAFTLPALVTFLCLWCLIRMSPGPGRAGLVVQSVLLRSYAALAFGFAGAKTVARMLHVQILSDRGRQWPRVLLFLALVVVLVVALQLLVGRLRTWRQREPAWFRAVPGRALSGLLGLGYALLLLAVLVPTSCLSIVELPAFRVPLFTPDRTYAPALVFQPPSEYVRSVVGSRLAVRFLDPADPWQALLFGIRVPWLDARVCEGPLRANCVPGYETVLDDDDPFRMASWRIVAASPARLVRGMPDFLVVRDSAGFDVLRFRDTLWELQGRLPFVNSYARFERGRTAWCTGDIDGDGQDEIVAGDSNRLVVIRWQNPGFACRTYDFRYQIDNLIVGDIDNDGRNEIVLSASDEKLVDGFERERICVARLTESGLDLLWNDRGALAIGDNRATPADQLLAIADIENQHVNELLVYRPSCREHPPPSAYSLLGWQRGQLRVLRSFSIVRGALAPSLDFLDPKYHHEPGFDATGALAVGRVGDRTVCVAHMFHGASIARPLFGGTEGGIDRTLLFTLTPGRLQSLGWLAPLYGNRDRLLAWPEGNLEMLLGRLADFGSSEDDDYCLIDPDGRGPAVLRITAKWWEPSHYALDRIALVAPAATAPR
jgi:hypothetical protein